MTEDEACQGMLEFLARIDELTDKEHRERAVAWVVVTVDDEFNHIVHCTGPFNTPEEALAEAGRRDRDDVRHELAGPDEKGWTHSVQPVLPPDPVTS